MSNRALVVITFVFALSLYGICPSAKCNDATGLPDWVTSFISQHLSCPAESSASSAMMPEEAARTLLDSLLDEDTIQPLLTDYRLRREFNRVAAYLKVSIANEFAKAFETEAPAMLARAMWWADGLMRLAPRDISQSLAMMQWERAPRPWPMAPDYYSPFGDEKLAYDYEAFLSTSGIDPNSRITESMMAATCLFGHYYPGDQRNYFYYFAGYKVLAITFWDSLHSLVIYNDKLAPRWGTDKALNIFADSSSETDRFIEATGYFRPYFVPVLLRSPRKGWTESETARSLIEGLLDVWDAWLSRH